MLEREGLRQQAIHTPEVRGDRKVPAGRYGEAVQAAYAAVRGEPLRESAHRAVVRVHLAEGNVAEAMRAYRSFREVLARELGLAPTRQMEELMSPARTCAEVDVAGPVSIPRPRPVVVPSTRVARHG